MNVLLSSDSWLHNDCLVPSSRKNNCNYNPYHLMSTLPGLSKNLELLVHLGQRCCWVPKHRGVACLSVLPPCLPSNMPAPCSGVGELNTRGPFTSQTTEPHPQPLHHILTEAPAFWVLWSMTSLGICTCCSQIPPLPCLQLSLPLSAPFICPSVSRSLCHFLPLSECKLNPSSAAVTQLSYTHSPRYHKPTPHTLANNPESQPAAVFGLGTTLLPVAVSFH